MAVSVARRALANAFRAAGLESPELDARVLLGHALGLDHAGLVAQGRELLSAASAAEIEALALRRLAGEPVARIVGAKEFWGLEFHLTRATLVPRPETETVVEAALEAIGGARLQPLRIADLGTGSGALLVALLKELPNAFGVATDVSEAALAAARGNAVRLEAGDRAAFVACDFAAALSGGFDLVVSNPPYVRSADIAGLAREVRDHDPAIALDGGLDGLNSYRALARDAVRLLKPSGHLVVELGAGMADDVGRLFRAAGLEPVSVRADLAGVARALVATTRDAGHHV
jgi:release factor glutamine methyltransferase